MKIKLDLHIHSLRSPDGCMSLEEIIARAKAAGLQGCAVCDHDLPPEDLPEFPDFLLIPGIEVSTPQGHLLGYFIRGPVLSGDLFTAAEEIHRQGGLAVLAHPFARHNQPQRLEPYVSALDGIEVFNSRAPRKNPQANVLARDFAQKHRLFPTAGSDAHVPQEIGNAFVELKVNNLSQESVKAALWAGNAQCGGLESPHRYVAQSQRRKLLRRHAGPLAWGKWLLFSAKCQAEDLLKRKDRASCL